MNESPALLKQELKRLRAEVAALRLQVHGRGRDFRRVERELEQARAHLGRVLPMAKRSCVQLGSSPCDHASCADIEAARVFLRCDEARRCTCDPFDFDGLHYVGCPLAPARDEARRCTCGGGRYEPVAEDHAPDCPAR